MTQKNPGDPFTDSISALLQDPEAIKEAAGKAAEGAADYARKHPYQTVAVAFAAGLLAGLFLGKRKSK
jgi:ElaB/YqjD/DUF883 family membrane-anchored ribosome-binding protein